MISERTELLKTFDGTEIYFRCSTMKPKSGSPEKIAGVVVAVHGFGEHSGRYAHVAEQVCKKGMAFATFDLRGHGKSGNRGDVESLHALVLDVLYVVNHTLLLLGFRNHSKDFFFGLLGHSYGGLLATYAASILAESCPPVFLSSPCYGVRQKLPFWKKKAANVLPKFAPEVKVPLGIQPDIISKNPANNKHYLEDKMNLKEASARFGKIVIESLNEQNISRAMASICAPVTLRYGADDELVDSEVTKRLASNFPEHLLDIQGIEGAGHEIFNERPEFQSQAFAELNKWIDAGGAVR